MKIKNLFGLAVVAAMFFVSCAPKQVLYLAENSAFDSIVDGKNVALYTLENNNGLKMQVTNYGARVVTLFVPDNKGVFTDIVLGYNSLSQYTSIKGERFLGATIGRYGNRIADGKFELDGVTYQLAAYNNGQCLHGGLKAFDRVVWNVDSVNRNALYLSYLSPDGEEGFPGNLDVKMNYFLTEDNEFKIEYFATTDKATPVNLTHHSFFNLIGAGNGTINDHELMINASKFTPVNEVLIPLGENVSVENTPFDFRTPIAIGARVDVEDTQLKMGSGYDHNFMLDRETEKDIELAATVYSPKNGVFMEVLTTEPAIQFYGGNFFDGSASGKDDKPYKFRESFALETQHCPDSPNQPNFPNTILRPGEKYTQTCIYKFSVK